jgi:hypothetical protein
VATTNTRVTSKRKYPKCLTPCSNSVSGGLSFRCSETLPNSVFAPVPVTSAWVVPLTTLVPKKRLFVRFPSGVVDGRVPAVFSAGKVSPVRDASFTKRSFDSRIRESPGIRSPALSLITSPGTISSTGISFGFPSRSTVAFV